MVITDEKCVPPLNGLNHTQFIHTLDVQGDVKQIELQNYIATLHDNVHPNNHDCRYYDNMDLTQVGGEYQNKISIFHLNISSLNKHYIELVAYLECLSHNFDVIMLSEVGRYNIGSFANILDGYSFEFVPARTKCGGVGIFYRNCYSLNSVDKNIIGDSLECDCPDCQIEDIWVDLTIDGYRCLCCTCYRHPKGNIRHFNIALEQVLNKVNSTEMIYFVGDVNIDLIKSNTLPANDDYLKLLSVFQFVPLITIPTRLTESTMTLIDHIFVKLPSHVTENSTTAGAIYCNISDHLPVFCCVDMSKKRVIERPLVRLYNEKNYTTFIQKVAASGLDDILRMDDPERAYTLFNNTLTSVHDECFPLVRLSRKKHKSKPWVTAGIKKSVNHKNKLFRQYITKPDTKHKHKLAKYRSILRNVLNAAESQYYKNLLNSRQSSSRKMWSVINELISSKPPKKSADIKLLEYGNKTLTCKYDIANAFNNYFATIGNKLADEIPDSNNNYAHFMDKNLTQSIFLHPVDNTELTREIHKLKIGKAPGIDGIQNKLLKSISNTVVPVLSHIFNICMLRGIYPSALKIAKVIPLYKKGDRTLPENYRPISLLPCVNKLLEKLIEKRLRLFLEKQNIFYDFQFGFRSGHSTSQALLEITNNIRSLLEKGQNVLGLYLDLKKAFDTVNHNILKSKLLNYGIRGNCYDLLSSYLSNRVQMTYVNGVYSAKEFVSTGVPQGSVLGPLLFLIYINDIKNVVTDVSIRLFADDTNIFMHDSDCVKLVFDAKNTLLKLKIWFDANKLTLHLGKTNFTIFHSKHRPNHECCNEFDIDGCSITRTDSTKYLGLIIDDMLSWKQHVTDLCNKLVKYTGIFYRTKTHIPSNIAIQIYYAFIYSRISYCVELYGQQNCQSFGHYK
jgi:hypothetical protein